MDNRKHEYWINRITQELKDNNNQPIWYDADLIKEINFISMIMEL